MRGVPGYSGLFARDGGTPESFWISLRYFNLYRMAIGCTLPGSRDHCVRQR